MYQKRQGDLLITKVPMKDYAFFQLSDDNIVARGEITHHKHQLMEGQFYTRPQAQRETDAGDNRLGYIIVEKEKTEIVHDEHEKVELEKGIYEVVQQREDSTRPDQLKRYVAPKVERVRD